MRISDWSSDVCSSDLLRRGSPVPAYAREHVLETLKWRFAYAFAGNAGYPASVDTIELRDHQAIGPIEVSAIEMPHGPIKASGLIFSDGAHKIAYATDFSKFKNRKDVVWGKGVS